MSETLSALAPGYYRLKNPVANPWLDRRTTTGLSSLETIPTILRVRHSTRTRWTPEDANLLVEIVVLETLGGQLLITEDSDGRLFEHYIGHRAAEDTRVGKLRAAVLAEMEPAPERIGYTYPRGGTMDADLRLDVARLLDMGVLTLDTLALARTANNAMSEDEDSAFTKRHGL